MGNSRPCRSALKLHHESCEHRAGLIRNFTTPPKSSGWISNAQLSGNYARLDMFKSRAAKQEMSDGVAAAKIRIGKGRAAANAGNEALQTIIPIPVALNRKRGTAVCSA
jgi:hypothetical protein